VDIVCIKLLSLIHHKSLGTKVSVNNNSIQYHEPTLYQGAMRTYQGDSRDDLHNLCYPITVALRWFPKGNKHYDLFYEQCIQGLAYLKNNYDHNSIINHTLSHYITLINDNNTEGDIPESPLINELREFWKEEEIEIIYMIYKYALTLEDTEKIIYLNMLETILTEKEKQINAFIQKISTSYE